MAFPPDEVRNELMPLEFASEVGDRQNWSLFSSRLCCTHIGVNFTRIIKAFIIFRNEPGGPAAFFNRLSEFTQMFGSTLYVAQTLLGDAIVLMRCYIVWERNLVVVAFPMLLLLGSTVTGVGILYSFDRVEPEAQVFVNELSQWIVSFFSMTFATNFICTALVAYRIWRINQKGLAFSNSHRRLGSVMVLIVESGSIYSAALLALLILYEADSWFQYVILDAITPTVGIVFSVIMYRILTGVSSPTGETRLIDEDVMDIHRMQTGGSFSSKFPSNVDVDAA
ncbi:hypothetical protein M422DRAFT_70236 [Sphaerobolus stellatus SS14]|uniref:Uncharacterized protein n=1 Tax=Sphaerobolus stellatus (strain SS14) TaxID=990650 RepID=A0A0C9VAC8_SPHS4|nr:hypothetical protein M422DRAFT_70236 [Sphaerobolus stellatus SS14]